MENAWFQLLNFRTSDGVFIPEAEFLARLKITNKVATASKQRSEGVHSGQKTERSVIQKTAEAIKSKFVQDGQNYLKYLLGEVLHEPGLSSNIIKGLAAFDPTVMLKRPIDIALKHFELLYSTFLLRSWVLEADESACRDDYLALLDHLRGNYPPTFDVTSVSRDLIDFMMTLDFLQSRERLLYLFKLFCLCATSVTPTYPVVTAGSVSTAGHRGRFTDVILPVQSYVSSVPGSAAFCCNEANLSKFSLFASSFGRSAFSADYDPWTYVDDFGGSKIYKSLLSTYKSILSVPKAVSTEAGTRGDDSVADECALKAPSASKRRRMSRSASRSRTSSVVDECVPSSSKN